MGLFDRIFRQPPTHKASSDENLATEIVAYFLESLPGFRGRFLTEGLKLATAVGDWEVVTQKTLHSPGKSWHGERPDVFLRCPSPATEIPATEIIVEVKIDAGVTLDRNGKPQTQHYEDYLKHARDTRGTETRLATLTRWTPDSSLRTATSLSIRFGQVVNWLTAAAREAPAEFQAAAALGEDWAAYLKKRRWAMIDLSQEHLNALRATKAMKELQNQLRDVAQAATDAAVSPGGTWRRQSKRKVSTPRFRDGWLQWGPMLTHKARTGAIVQVGCHYGLHQGVPCIQPAMWFSRETLPEPRLRWSVEVFCDGWVVLRDDVAGLLESRTSTEIWDQMKAQLAECLDEVDKLIREPPPPRKRSGFPNPLKWLRR